MEPVHLPIGDVLDLHTFRPSEIADLLEDYFTECQHLGIRAVRLIHGKGSGALRERVHALLRRNPRVSAFRLAPPEAGGWGATLVVLKGEASMTAQEILGSEDFKRCEVFHGHVCPGLSIGYRAAKAGLAWLKEKRAADEELVAIVETDACSADAVQVITGCTFGKGNFLHRDYGKNALTLFSRQTGQGVRLIVRPAAFTASEEHLALVGKISRDEASEAEREHFRQLHFQRICDVLEKPDEDLFLITAVQTRMPPRAAIEPSEPCACCGEATMPSKMALKGTRKLCRGCLAAS